MDRILLGHLVSNGDCLYATILARQLRNDFPKAHITWAVSKACAGAVANNPDVDEFWILPSPGAHSKHLSWNLFEREALQRYMRREFDHVLLSQIWPDNYQNFDGTVRPSILRAYGKPITVPIANVIKLTDAEIERVEAFSVANQLLDFEHRILFECSPSSGQSFITAELAQDIAAELYKALPNATVVFNSHLPMKLRDPRSRYSGSLSLREFAHLTRYGTLFVGVGSGGSVAATSTAAKPLPMIQLILGSTSVFASFAHDFEYFAIKDRKIVEMTNQDTQVAAACIATACREGIDVAETMFGERIPVQFDGYLHTVEHGLVMRHRYLDAARSLAITAERYGWTADLSAFAKSRVLPNLSADQSWIFAPNRRRGNEIRDQVYAALAAPAPEPRQRLFV
jgi:hypothetical protein